MPNRQRTGLTLLVAALLVAASREAAAQDGVQVVGQTPAEVQAADPLPGVQDGGVEIQAGDGTQVRQPGGPDDPRDAPDGDDPRDEPLPENVCGPDVTAAYVLALQRGFKRLQELPDDAKGLYDATSFMETNGTNIDAVPDDIDLPDGGDRCPRGICKKWGDIQPASVTIAGHCLPAHVSNDIMYGFVAYLLDLPWAVAVAGAQFVETRNYGWHWEPPTSIGGYMVGWALAGKMSEGQQISEADIKEQIENTRVARPKRLGGLWAYGSEEMTLLEWVAALDSESYVLQCAPCPEPCTSGFAKEFTTTTWILNDGKRLDYQE